MRKLKSLSTSSLLFILARIGIVSAQTFQRLGACPTLGCILPPDQTDFLAGQLFDIRLEVHAPVNGSESSNNGVPDENFQFCIQYGDESCVDVSQYFKIASPSIEKWTFSYVML